MFRQQQTTKETTTTSQFMYQCPGNDEAHGTDLGPPIQEVINEALLQRIYPVIQDAFGDVLASEEEDNNDMSLLRVFLFMAFVKFITMPLDHQTTHHVLSTSGWSY
jgi:hypothetical protein